MEETKPGLTYEELEAEYIRLDNDCKAAKRKHNSEKEWSKRLSTKLKKQIRRLGEEPEV